MKVITRRKFFQHMAMLGLVTFTTTGLHAKGTQAKYLYQNIPKDGKKCIDCIHFHPETKECTLVEGTISPDGYCTAFYKDPRQK